MRSVVRWEPMSDLISLRDAMNRLFEESFVQPWRGEESMPDGSLALDMQETDKEYVVKADVPGFKPEDVDISIADGILTIKGEMKTEEEKKEGDYIYKERRFGSFRRSVALPQDVKADKTEASIENGVLMLHIPKSEQAKPTEIKIKPKVV